MRSIARGLASLTLGGLLLGLATVAAATPGDLDPTFGAGGIVATNLGGSDYPAAVVLQPDGKIVIAGHRIVGPVDTSRYGILLVRYRPDGTLDATFGAGGFVVTEFGPGTIAYATAVVLQPDGKILVAGTAGLISGVFGGALVARYHPDGTLDATFGTGGLVLGPGGGRALAIQADGRIVVAGNVYVPPTVLVSLARYTANGILDPTFGVGGTTVTNFGADTHTRKMGLQPDGKIVLTAWTMWPAPPGFRVARYTADGILDPAFAQGGIAVTSIGTPSLALGADPLALGVMADGRIVAGGGSGTDVALARYLPDGRLDPSFGAAGTVTTDLGGYEAAYTLVVQPDGRIVVAGGMGIPADRARSGPALSGVVYGLARYTPSGALDASFGTGGGRAIDFFPEVLALQPDGKILVAGYRFPNLMMVRFLGSP
jgi:uncharacterized delta-60 repeat protein